VVFEGLARVWNFLPSPQKGRIVPQYRQGDVFLHPTTKRSYCGHAHPPTERGIVVHQGENSRHAHVISSGATVYDVHRLARPHPPSDLMLEVTDAEVKLTHEEHDPIIIEQGLYEVRRPREYNEEMWRGPQWIGD
jgi:hypothetical protein